MAINEGRVSGSVTAINLAARAKAFVFGALLIWSMGDVCRAGRKRRNVALVMERDPDTLDRIILGLVIIRARSRDY